jgi:AmmeMemoRadiSam system protein B
VKVRPPVYAGRFYPAEPDDLREQIERFLGDASPAEPEPGRPEALIVPHAGYEFSGPVAASGYARLVPWASAIQRVILLGTCHTAGVSGLATTSDEAFATPLGTIPLDRNAVDRSLELSQVHIHDSAHHRDHALEVQLPFLQVLLDTFTIVPFLVGRADEDDVAEVLEALWESDRTVIVVSSDLSHYYPYEDARLLDRATAQAIERLDGDSLGPKSACGRNAIAGLLSAARHRGLCSHTVDLRSSGDTAGRRDRVVGYGAFLFISPSESQPELWQGSRSGFPA